MKKLSVLLLAVLVIFIFVLPAQADDPYEPNYSPELATPMVFGGPLNNQVYAATDYDTGHPKAEVWPKDDTDWYKFDTVTDDTLLFELRPYVITLDLYFKLYFEKNTFIADKQSSGPGETEYFNFIVPPNSSGTYYVEVSSFGHTTTGPYRLMVTKKLARATSIKITCPNEKDITLMAGQTYNITWITSGVSLPGVKIELYKNGVWCQNISGNAPNTGSYAWKVPSQTVTGSDYKIKITALNDATLYDWSDNNFTTPVTGKENGPVAPKQLALSQNYPNPFNPGTSIGYTLPQAGQVKLSVFDMLGRTLAVPVNEQQEAGHYCVKFDGTNFSAGMYFYRLEFNGATVRTIKMVLAK